MNNKTQNFYDTHAKTYFDSTVNLDLTGLRKRFVSNLKPGALILDAGCGSGRDTLAFAKQGFEMVAFDGCSEMAKLATVHSGISVHTLRFSEVKWQGEFDGVWACASLVHLDRPDAEDALRKLTGALKPGGTLFLSLKQGSSSYLDSQGRHFNRYRSNSALRLLSAAGLIPDECWMSANVVEPAALWLNLIGHKETLPSLLASARIAHSA